jgi:hypothetical protein
MTVTVKIKSATLVQDQWGHHIEITKVGLYDEKGKFIKWTKLNQELIDLLIKQDIKVHFEENQ